MGGGGGRACGPPLARPLARRAPAIVGSALHAQKKKKTTAIHQVLGLGTDTGDATPSALLFFDRRRLLFNAGEGFQRYAGEAGVRVARVTDVLLTRSDAAAAGGLPGLCLSLAEPGGGGARADGGAPVSVVGPPGLAALARAARSFVSARVDVIQASEFGAGAPAAVTELPPVVRDGDVTVTPVLLAPGAADQAGADGEPAAKRARTAPPPSSRLLPSVVYAVDLAPIPGKFRPDAALAAGVPRGPLFGQLKAGRAVVLADGTVVPPDACCAPGSPGPCVLVVDAATDAHAGLLPGAAPLARFAANGSDGARVAAVLHLTPAAIVASDAYRAWVASFGPAATHIFANAAATGAASVHASSAALGARLAAVDAALFPLHQGLGDDARSAGIAPTAGPAVAGRDRLKFHLRPPSRAGLDAGAVQKVLDPTAVQADLMASHGPLVDAARSALAAARAAPPPNLPPCMAPAARGNVEVVFLGTGAAQPSKYRNVSGTLLRTRREGADPPAPTPATLLLDCGEGTAAQVTRAYGSGADAVLVSLMGVWISHIHADHHAGLPGVLAARARAFARAGAAPPPLLLLGPDPLRRVLVEYDKLAPTGVVFLDCRDAARAGAAAAEESGGSQDGAALDPGAMLADLKATMGLRSLACVRVVHCAHSYGLVVETDSATARAKLAFSGDTVRCPALVQAASDAHLLVHEATFEDGLEGEAAAKKHSTTGDAVAVGRESRAHVLLLTHFSQRYPKLPAVRDPGHVVGVAFDLMRVDLADAPALPALTAPLTALFDAVEAAKAGGLDKET